MTALNSNAGVPGILRMGVGSAADATLAGVQTEGTRLDAGRGSNRTLSPDSLTEHIQPVDYGSDQAIASPRECDCPPQVIRCVHLEERRVALAIRPCPQHPCPFDVARQHGSPTGKFPCCDAPGWLIHNGWKPYYQGDSEADALAAFYAAEAELLGREA